MATYLDLEELNKCWTGEVCIFGAGQLGRGIAYELLTAAGFNISFYCDNYILEGTFIRNKIIIRNNQYLYDNKDNILVFLCISAKYQEEVLAQLNEHEVKHIVVVDWDYIAHVLDSIDASNENAIKRKYFSIYDDIEFLKKKFEQRTGYKLNIDNPTTFNEKLQWLKVYNHNPEYTQMVDKYAVKEYVGEKIGEEYIISTLGVYDNFDEINFNELPNQFVLKCTHDSGSVVIVDDAEKLDKKAVKERLNRALSINYFWAGREWPYKNVRPQIIAEKYLCDSSGTELKDYKFFCFNGSVKLIQVDFDRFVEHKRNVYNRQWEYIPLVIEFPTEPERIIRKPICFDEMIEIAEKLSIGISHVRIDFYVIEDKPIVGEMTFYHGSGLEKIVPIEWDKILGDWIELPEKREYDNKT